MKKIGLLFLLAISSIPAFSQYFREVDSVRVVENSNTLRNPWAGGINFPNVCEIDLNGDGRKDLFLYDRLNSRITTFLNNGSTNADLAWDYAPQYETLFPPISNWALLYDYNCDGKEDLFTISPQGGSVMAVYRNDYTPSSGLQWTMVTDFLDEAFSTTRQNIYVNGVSLPAFADIDADGDVDILGYVNLSPGRMAYHKNYSQEHYGVCDSLDFKFETACWGDFSLLIGGSNQVGCFHCPCRTAGPTFPDDITDLPEISGDQSKAAQPDDTVSSILLLDIDGDSDQDLLVGDVASDNSLLIVNDGTPAAADMGSQDTGFPSYDQSAMFNGFHFHAYIDLDNDGLKDLLAISDENENSHGMWFYKNVGTASVPLFEFREDNFLQNQMIEAGEVATPSVVDFDGDGLLDIVMGYNQYIGSTGGYKLSLRFYKNTGTPTNPAFELMNSDVSTISQFNYLAMIYPTFGDLDGDGDLDLLLGQNQGYIDYFTNTAGAGNVPTFSFTTNRYMRIDVGNFITPQLFDVDKDGLLDIVAGEQTGNLNYFHNNGTASQAQFDSIPNNALFGCVVLHNASTPEGYTTPFLYDSLGTTLMAVSCSDGLVYRYDSLDGNLNGCFHLQGLMNSRSESTRFKYNIGVTGGDLNNDGKMDFVIGQSTGGLQLQYQTSSAISVPEVSAVLPSMEVFPNPSGDVFHIRLFNLGNESALLRLYNLTGSLIEEKRVTNTSIDLEATSLSKGVYLVQLISGKRVVNTRIEVIR